MRHPRSRLALLLPVLVAAALAGCGTGPASKAPSDPLAALHGATSNKAYLELAKHRPPVLPLPAGQEAKVEHEVATDPKYAALHQALVASGASPAQIHDAISGAFYYGTGHPQDVRMARWSRLHDDAVHAARNFLDKLGRAEAAKGVHVDRAELERDTGLVSLAAQPLTTEK